MLIVLGGFCILIAVDIDQRLFAVSSTSSKRELAFYAFVSATDVVRALVPLAIAYKCFGGEL